MREEQSAEAIRHSPARDGGDDAACAVIGNLDQRGHARPHGPRCDIGAYEFDVAKCADTPLPSCAHQATGRAALSIAAGTDPAKRSVKARGPTMPPPALGNGLTYPVTAQIVTSQASCWSAEFSAADEKANDAKTFKASKKAP